MKVKRIMHTLAFGLLATSSLFAESGRNDYDIDNDGLIEINDLNDLNEIRNNRFDIELYGTDRGCPSDGCIGYELTRNLNFDTYRDGRINSRDAFWNNGKGWLPLERLIGFEGIFEGNNFQIQNLMINRPDTNNVGFFERLRNATIRNLRFTGSLTSIRGGNTTGGLASNVSSNVTIENVSLVGSVSGANDVGGLVGRATFTTKIINSYTSGSVSGTNDIGGILGSNNSAVITSSYSTSRVSGTDYIGGIIGNNTFGEVHGSFATGTITGNRYVGGLLGYSSGGDISSSFASGRVTGETYVGGLIGRNVFGYTTATYAVGYVNGQSNEGGLFGRAYDRYLSSNYWATNTTGQSENSGYSYDATTEGGYTVAQLRCPTQPTNTSCVTDRLFDGWEIYVDSNGIPLWEFGTSSQLPGLRINGRVYRDNNYNGTIESSTAPSRTPNPDLMATHNYINSGSFCGWSNPRETDDENVTESTLYCNMGSHRVATKLENRNGSCEIDLHHNDYEMTLLSEGSCHYGIFRPGSAIPTSTLIATQSYVNTQRFCGWSPPVGGMGITTSHLRCYMGTQHVATRINYATRTVNGVVQSANIAGITNGCAISIHLDNYELSNYVISNGRCNYTITQTGTSNSSSSSNSGSSSSEPTVETFAYKAPGVSGATLARGCEWRLNFQNYGITSHYLYCDGVRFGEVSLYDRSNIGGVQNSCEVRNLRSGLSGAGTYGYGQSGNPNACTFRITGTR